VKVDEWRCMDRSRKIGKQMTGQLFGASAPLAPLALLALRAPAGGVLVAIRFGPREHVQDELRAAEGE
jgi:hypothetical protein